MRGVTSEQEAAFWANYETQCSLHIKADGSAVLVKRSGHLVIALDGTTTPQENLCHPNIYQIP